MEHHHGPRARIPLFYKNGPWVHITVEYATSTANFCPLSLSNSFLTGLHDKTACLAEKKRRENCFDLKICLLLGNLQLFALRVTRVDN